MSELLLGLLGGVIVVVTAFVTRFLSKRDASHSGRVIEKAVTSHEAKVEEVEEILDGPTPEEDLADLINEKLNG